MKLVQVRPCDGACCREVPQWPDGKGGCAYQREDGKCRILAGECEAPDPAAFQKNCVEWPHKHSTPRKGSSCTGGCCWQWQLTQ